MVRLNIEYAEQGFEAIVLGCRWDVTQLVIPDTYNGMPVVGIAPGAFRDFPNLLYVDLPDSLQYVDEEAFADCHALMSVRAGRGLKYLGEHAFFRCTSLTELNFETVPDADITAFAGCCLLTQQGEIASYRRT